MKLRCLVVYSNWEVNVVGYKILYTPENNEKYPLHNARFPNRIVSVICFSLIIALAFAIVYHGFENTGEILLPGDPAHLRETAEQMIRTLQRGTPIGQAITAFCQEIIGHGMQAV